MPKPGCIPLRPLSVGDVFSGAIEVVGRNARALFAVSAVVALLPALITIISAATGLHRFNASGSTNGGQTDFSLQVDFLSLAAEAMSVIAGPLAVAFVTVFVGEDVVGRRAALGRTWHQLAPRIWPLVGLALLTGIVSALGLIACLVPGFWLWTIWSVATPAFVLERRGVLASLGRSFDLVRGNFWRIAGIRILVTLCGFVVGGIASAPFLVGGVASGSGGGLWSGGASAAFVVLSAVGSFVAGALVMPFTAAADALLYMDLRMRKENLAPELVQAAAFSR